ncbi:MAG TPA: hypothetical protein ENN33_00285 [Ignavibacteria bacterium]|nr:hypothetical protein [Ignavibacteria bacterium]
MNAYIKLRKAKLIFLFVIAIFFFGCKKEEIPETIIAKVGERFLTEKQLDSLLTFTKNKNKFREEVIRDWMDSEVLYLEAQKADILMDEDYLQLADESSKMLANAFLIKKYLSDNVTKADESALLEYYNNHKNELSITSKAFVYNHAAFNDEAKAILFRETLLGSDWGKAANVFSGDQSIVDLTKEKFVFEYDVPTKTIHVILSNLLEGETSIIFPTEKNTFDVIQLIKFYEALSTPDFIHIKKSVEDRYLMIEKSRLYDNLMSTLYSKYDVLIYR